jgi:hypothetical protein
MTQSEGPYVNMTFIRVMGASPCVRQLALRPRDLWVEFVFRLMNLRSHLLTAMRPMVWYSFSLLFISILTRITAVGCSAWRTPVLVAAP